MRALVRVSRCNAAPAPLYDNPHSLGQRRCVGWDGGGPKGMHSLKSRRVRTHLPVVCTRPDDARADAAAMRRVTTTQNARVEFGGRRVLGVEQNCVCVCVLV